MSPVRRRPRFAALARDQHGATAVEYGLILSLVVLAALGALSGLADAVVGKWTLIASMVTGA